ncbi:transposase [Budvicia aquatica]|uniref:Transposase and inactivated derivatives n=1 Tax=Budvicia aquatica TaxID=82979 RepID=A0A484ZH23_9GAMM|nr:Transposase and inactivated derivatives [Budvicia aquatica]
MIRLNPECPHCHQKDAIRSTGPSKIGLQRYLCRRCNKTFQARYYYRAHDHNLSRQIGGACSKWLEFAENRPASED